MSTDPYPGLHPRLPAGMNAVPVCGDEINGVGINQVVYTAQWDDILMFRPTILTPTDNLGQTVDMRVPSERRRTVIRRDRNKSRTSGFRGNLEAPQ